jgi:hypothetical protein
MPWHPPDSECTWHTELSALAVDHAHQQPDPIGEPSGEAELAKAEGRWGMTAQAGLVRHHVYRNHCG